VEGLQARTGFPARAFDILRHHSAIDIDHGSELFEPIDR
jgi:hypothetical protein